MVQMKAIDELITTQKPKTYFDGSFLEKMRLDCQSGPKILSLFLLIFFKLVMFIGLLKAYMKSIDQLSLMQKKLTLFGVPFWKKSGKSVNGVNFFEDGFVGR